MYDYSRHRLKIDLEKMSHIFEEVSVQQSPDADLGGTFDFYNLVYKNRDGSYITVYTDLLEGTAHLVLKKNDKIALFLHFDRCEKIEVVNLKKKQIEIVGGIAGKKNAKCLVSLEEREDFLIQFS